MRRPGDMFITTITTTVRRIIGHRITGLLVVRQAVRPCRQRRFQEDIIVITDFNREKQGRCDGIRIVYLFFIWETF